MGSEVLLKTHDGKNYTIPIQKKQEAEFKKELKERIRQATITSTVNVNRRNNLPRREDMIGINFNVDIPGTMKYRDTLEPKERGYMDLIICGAARTRERNYRHGGARKDAVSGRAAADPYCELESCRGKKILDTREHQIYICESRDHLRNDHTRYLKTILDTLEPCTKLCGIKIYNEKRVKIEELQETMLKIHLDEWNRVENNPENRDNAQSDICEQDEQERNEEEKE